MADLTGIEVTDMPSANSVGSADYFMIVQSGVNKKAPKSLVLDGIATEDETGNKVDLEINSSTYVMVAKLYDKNNNLLSTSSPIDLPLETMVVGAEYDEETKEIVLTLKNGTTVRFSVADLIDGLVSEDTFNAAIDALQNEINNIASQIVTTETKEDTVFTINDTFDSLMKVGIKGNVEQDSYSGKNKFGTDLVIVNPNKITILDSEKNNFSIKNMWAENFMTNTELLKMIEPNTQYIASCKFKVISRPSTLGSANTNRIIALFDGSNVISLLAYSSKTTCTIGTTYEISTTFTAPTDLTNYRLITYDYKDSDNVTTGEIEIDNLQIEEGSSATEYEQYVGGTPSPNPDFPQNVKVVTGDNSIVIQNKNLFYNRSSHTTSNATRTYLDTGLRVTSGSGSGACYVVYTIYNIKPNTKYTIKCNETMSSEDGYAGILFRERNGTTNIGSYTLLPSNNVIKRTVTTLANTDNIRLYFYSKQAGNGTYTDYTNIQLEINDAATTYVAHAEQIYPISLGSIELCKIGTYQDYIVGSYNNWKIVRNVGKVVLNGSETYWNLGGSGTNIITKRFYGNINLSVNNVKVFSNYFIDKDYTWNQIQLRDEELIAYSNSYLQVRISVEKATTVAEFKTWLSNHNTTVYYVLATPTEIPITDATLITQLNNLADARSYVGQTNVSSTYESGNAPMVINATALTGGLLYKSAIVTSISAASTDEQVPSAKCVYGIVGDINTLLDNLNRGGNIVWEQQ